jgi:L-fucose isomerase
MLMNGTVDADGPKPITVHACESDADGALSMQILHLISGGNSAALMDIRWYDPQTQVWTLANCGAIPAGLCATCADPTGLSAVRMEPHVFGRGGGGALPATVNPQTVTLARLCRKNGEYWMAIVLGTTLSQNGNTPITPAFPKAYVRSTAGIDFLNVFGSNHIHLVAGDYTEELIAFCTMAGLEYRLWK